MISGKYAIDIYGTATITNSDIIGGNGSALLVGGEEQEGGVVTQVYDGCLTIGEDVYIRGYVNQGIEYQFGTVILKALPTFGTERPTTSSTTRAKTRDPETYDIAIPPGRSLTFEEGTFNTTDRQPISIFIKKDGVPIDPTTYTNPITTNYSKYVKDGGKVIDPNDVFSWYGNDVNFTCRFRMNAAGEVILNHAAATVTSYDVDNSTVTTTPYYDFSEAIAAANSGYKTASEAGGTEFIPTLKMLDDVSFDTGVEIGNGSTVTKVTLDLNGKEISGAVSGGVITVKSGATLTLVDNGTDPNETGTIENTNTSSARGVMVESGGTLFANGGSIVCSDGYAIFNEGTADINGCDLSAKYGIYSNNTATVANCAISATTYGIHEYNGSTTVGEGVSFSGNREASIYKHLGTLTLTVWPTFGGSETEGYADIKLYNGRAVTFSGIGLGAPTQNVTLRMVGSSDSETVTLTITPNAGYVLNTVSYNNTVITPVNGAYTFTMPAADVTITATWKIQTEISVQNTSLELKVLDEVATGATLTNVVSSTAVTDENVTLTYTSSNSNVAKVEDGNIICLAAGTATITVSFAGNDKYAAAESKTMNVTVSLNDASVSVSDGGKEMTSLNLYVDDTYTIVPTTTPEGLAVTYAADGSGVVSVDENGVVTALKAGTGSIVLKVGGDGVYAESSKTVTVNVSKVPTAISLNEPPFGYNFNVRDEVNTGATLSPADAGTLTYTSNNESVAKVEGGNIICLAAGTATITVSFAGNDKYAAAENKTMNVTVSLNDASVSVDDNAFDLLVGETHTIAATTTPEGLDVTYAADESGVVSVDENGVVTALKDGTATVTVSVGGDGVYAENSTTVTVTVSSYEMADLFSGSNQWTGYVAVRNLGVPAGLTAYIVTALGAETATATEIAYIPQGEPVLLRRSDKTVNSYASFIYTGSASTPDGNLLKAATATSQPTAYRDFVLYQDAFVLVGEGTLATGKVYLPAPQASQSRDASRSIVVDGDDTTGMSEELRVKGEESDGDWYNLQGRRLGGKPTKKGLYIHNNKMEVVR